MMYQKVKPGDAFQFSSGLYNALIEMVDARMRSHHQPDAVTNREPHSYVMVKNTSGADVAMFGVLGIDGPIFEPIDSLNSFQYTPVLKGVAPGAAHSDKFVVLQEPLAADQIGRACISGMTPVRLKVDAENVAEQKASIVEGETAFLGANSDSGAVILWVDNIDHESLPTENDLDLEDETQWALILMGGSSDASSAPQIHAVVMEPIRQTPDPTVGPAGYVYGKVRIVGKEYEEEDPAYDDCACLLLAGAPGDEHPQQLVKGEVHVVKEYQRANPDFDPEQEESKDNPKTFTYYLVPDPTSLYVAALDADLNHGGTSTVTIKDSDDQGTPMTVRCSKLYKDSQREEYIPEGVSGYEIHRVRSDEGFNVLEIMTGPCVREIPEA